MINKYQKDGKTKKEYKISFVKEGQGKDGRPYTMLGIADCKKQPDETFKYENYAVFTYQTVSAQKGDKLTFGEIKALEVEESEYQGKASLRRTIFADVEIITQTPNRVEVVDNGDIFDGNDDFLPF